MPEKKTHLTDEKLEEFRRKLGEERGSRETDRERILEEIEEASGRGTAGGGLSDVPTHFADQGTQDQVHVQDEKRAELLLEEIRQIDEALERIDAGTYGLCQVDGEPISDERLQAKPWARYCRDHAEKLGPTPPPEPGRAGQA